MGSVRRRNELVFIDFLLSSRGFFLPIILSFTGSLSYVSFFLSFLYFFRYSFSLCLQLALATCYLLFFLPISHFRHVTFFSTLPPDWFGVSVILMFSNCNLTDICL
jgi:hypothetical protein